VRIPANTEQNVPVKLVKSTWRSTTSADWVVHPKQIEENVFTVRVLVPGETRHASVGDVNLSEHTVDLPADTDLGTAEVAIVIPGPVDTGPKSMWSKAAGGTTYEHLQSVVDSLPTELSMEERLEAVELLHQYQDVFSCHEYDLGRTTLVEHKIDTSDARPIKQGLRRQAQTTHTIIDEFTSNMEKQGIIDKSASPWASNVVVVTKSDGTLRITLDYRMLNNVTYKDSYPLPNISDCLDVLKGSSWFGILDLRSSFYQVPLADADRDKTAFITRRGQWRFCSLPMGLSNSPATFQRLMDMVLRGLSWESVLVYIDDIVVYADTYDELKIRFEEVFRRLQGANLKLKPTKVRLFQREIQFLGHRISGKGVAMDPAKISEIVSWHRPKSVHEVWQFLGLCGYYRRYVQDYTRIAAPLHKLTKLGEQFLWTEVRDNANEKLKTHLVTAPILAMSLDVGKYTLDVNASNWAAGAVLQQEQGGMIFGMKNYRQYLLGRNL